MITIATRRVFSALRSPSALQITPWSHTRLIYRYSTTNTESTAQRERKKKTERRIRLMNAKAEKKKAKIQSIQANKFKSPITVAYSYDSTWLFRGVGLSVLVQGAAWWGTAQLNYMDERLFLGCVAVSCFTTAMLVTYARRTVGAIEFDPKDPSRVRIGTYSLLGSLTYHYYNIGDIKTYRNPIRPGFASNPAVGYSFRLGKQTVPHRLDVNGSFNDLKLLRKLGFEIDSSLEKKHE